MEKLVGCICGAKLKIHNSNSKFKCPKCKRIHEWINDYELVATVNKRSKYLVKFLGRGHKQRRLRKERVLLK